jgi:UrcA family protein
MISFRWLGITVLLTATLCSSVSGAEEYRVSYGDLDLNSHVDALSFQRRTDAVATRFCSARGDMMDLTGRAVCMRAIRDEVKAGLSEGNQLRYARGLNLRIPAIPEKMQVAVASSNLR